MVLLIIKLISVICINISYQIVAPFATIAGQEMKTNAHVLVLTDGSDQAARVSIIIRKRIVHCNLLQFGRN